MPRILNLGSLNIDYIYRMERVASPGETRASTKFSRGAGGKGLNQSIALARAGAEVFHTGCVGREAAWLRELLEAEQVDTTRLQAVDLAPGHAIIQVDEAGRNAIVLHGGANLALTPCQLPGLFDGFGPGDWFLTQNETSCVPEALAAARTRGMTVCFNPAPMHAAVAAYPLAAVDWLVVNEHEGGELGGGTTPAEILRGLRRRCPRAHLVLTLGAEGAWGVPPEGDAVFAAAPAVQAVDTFIGYLLASSMQGAPLRTALELACHAGAVCVTRAGAAASIPHRHELGLEPCQISAVSPT
ncbi:MAG: PfkB family carbohydrate kinase [Candidatus Didemnitutus sp.]|nr:PfkB family carbohydrate kinase [Candidatus Didemnitutus sp.]